MSVPFLSVKPRAIRLKVSPKFPANVIGRNGIDVTKDGGNFIFDLDYTDFPVIGAVPAGATYALIYDPATGKYAQVPISLLGGGGGIAEPPADGAMYGRQNTAGTGAWARAVALAGDTMSGLLTLSGAPTASLHAATKAYVDGRSRFIITSTLNLFVNGTTGSDSNDGLTAGTAFATLQKAMDFIASVDTSIYGASVTVANGTYATLILKSYIGSGQVSFTGNNASPSSCVISSAGNAILVNGTGGNFNISGFRLQSSTTQDVQVSTLCKLTLQNIEYNGSGNNYRVYGQGGAAITFSGANHKVFMGGIGFICVEMQATAFLNSATITWGASVTYGTTITARRFGYVEGTGVIFSLGVFTVTGQRYSCASCGGMAGFGGANVIPGTTAGSFDSTSFYS
ncbi:hypothetical protein [Bradyrhizobium sp. SEMIA]|uniref:hypothetical protein n=1 Tax=Bradyrhizobium sp. SEMIA TaxID=2597515 RepID=UPI0018A47133|nr:hypothetical protein [Bradyrhizobium sp. SEMIA]QOG23166.1 hypothetical protein FOM02_43880 [Bradyrhizobium sp. SEMIA]